MSRIGTLYPGDTRRILLTIADPNEPSLKYNLNQAAQIEMVVGICGEVENLVITWDVDGSIIQGPATDGTVLLPVNAGDTEDLEEGDYEVRFRVIETDGDRYTVYTERVKVPCAFPSPTAP